MREIKFRAWEDGKMYYQVRCGGFFNGDSTAPSVYIENKGWVNMTGGEDTEIMQYIGLKDKNGKEIYEGDIISYTQHLFNTEKTYEKKKEVKWNSDRWNVYETNAGESNIEIIGNI